MTDIEDDKKTLRKVIGLPEAVAFGIGGMIGGGIFALSGSVAEQAGLTSIFVFIIAALTAMCSALPYAEFSTVIIGSGGGYSYVNEVFPEFVGFVAGWWFFLAYTLAGAFYAVVFGIYLELIVGIHYYLFSLTLIIIFSIINVLGTKESSKTEILLVFFKLCIIVIFTVGGLLSLRVIPSNITFTLNGMLILNLVATVFIAFEGFDIIATLSKETREPAKVIPKAVVVSMVTVTVLYILVVIVELLTIAKQIVPPNATPEEVILYAAYEVLGVGGIYMLTSAAIVSTMSAYNATLCAVSRVGYAMGNNKALPRVFRMLHPKFNTPHASILMSSLIMLGVITLLGFFIGKNTLSLTLGQLASLAFAFSFAIVDFSLVIHRNIHTTLERKFRTPVYPITPIYGMLSAIIFGMVIAAQNMVILLIFLGLTIFGAIGYLVLVKNARSLPEMINIIQSDILKAREALALRKFINELNKERWWKSLKRKLHERK